MTITKANVMLQQCDIEASIIYKFVQNAQIA